MTLRRWLALCGVVAAVLVPMGFLLGGSGSPDKDASAAKVLSHYRAHDSGNRLGALLMLIAAVLLVLFAARLREVIRGGDEGEAMLALAAFGGAVLTSAGLIFVGVVHLALVSAADDNFTTEAHVLNVLDNLTFEAVVIGFAVLFLAAGIATVRQPVLPRWLGWVAILIGVLCMAGPIGFAGFILGLIWLLVVGIMLLARKDLVEVGAVAVTTPV